MIFVRCECGCGREPLREEPPVCNGAPVDEELEFRCRLRDRDGRKLVIEGEARHDGDVVATDEGLIVAIDPARLCPRPSPGGVDAPGGPWAVPALTRSRAISRR